MANETDKTVKDLIDARIKRASNTSEPASRRPQSWAEEALGLILSEVPPFKLLLTPPMMEAALATEGYDDRFEELSDYLHRVFTAMVRASEQPIDLIDLGKISPHAKV